MNRFRALAASLALSGLILLPKFALASAEADRLTSKGTWAPFNMELTPEWLGLLGNKDFRHAIGIAARVGVMKKAAARGDVLTWGRAAMPDKFTLPFCKELHQYFVDIRRETLSAVKAPRGFAKTVIAANLIPLYQALEEPKSFKYYLNVQANDDKAMSVNRAIKYELEHNEVLQAAYGNQISDRWTDAELMTRGGVVFKSVGAGVSIRGLQYHNRRPDYVIVDDLYDEGAIHNIDVTERMNSWLKGTLLKVQARSRKSCFHVRGTAINRSDILTEMVSWPGCVSKTFSAYKEDGTSLWPELYSLKDLEDDRSRMGSVIFNREMMNQCQDDSEAIVRSSWLTNWEYTPATKWARGFTRECFRYAIRLSCDPSIGEKMLNDYSAFALVIVTGRPDGSRKDYWIEGLWNEHLTLDGRIALLERVKQQQLAKGPEWHITQAPLEGVAGFADFVAQAKARTNLPVIAIKTVKDKISNLESKSPYFENGQVHISTDIPKPMRDMLLDQLVTNKPRHDDLRDAVLLCMEDTHTLSMRDWV